MVQTETCCHLITSSSSSSSCSGRIRFDSCSLYPQNEIGPSISSSAVLCDPSNLALLSYWVSVRFFLLRVFWVFWCPLDRLLARRGVSLMVGRKFLRHLLGITKLDKEYNQCIREKTGAQNIVKEIKQYQEKWLQHIQRMDTNRIPKQALQYKPKGRRHIGRPRKRWRDQFHFEDTRNRNQT